MHFIALLTWGLLVRCADEYGWVWTYNFELNVMKDKKIKRIQKCWSIDFIKSSFSGFQWNTAHFQWNSLFKWSYPCNNLTDFAYFRKKSWVYWTFPDRRESFAFERHPGCKVRIKHKHLHYPLTHHTDQFFPLFVLKQSFNRTLLSATIYRAFTKYSSQILIGDAIRTFHFNYGECTFYL